MRIRCRGLRGLIRLVRSWLDVEDFEVAFSDFCVVTGLVFFERGVSGWASIYEAESTFWLSGGWSNARRSKNKVVYS